MKPYDQLTFRGRLRRLRGLAVDALRQFGVDAARLQLIGYDTNIIYRVWTSGGGQYALRLANPAWRSAETAVSEAMWLDALACDTDIPVPKIERTVGGNTVVFPKAAGAPTNRHAVLMRWQPGVLLGKRLTAKNIARMGELFGKLHQHSANWQPPAGFITQRFDQMLSRGEPNMLFAEENLAVYSVQTESLLSQMNQRVAETYVGLDPADLRVIHCDLWHDNIKIYRGQLHPFDFEDTIWGFRLHDIAMAMLDLYETVNDSTHYDQLLTTFRASYESILPWPDGEMVLLKFGRLLWKTNWIARFWPDGLAKTAAFHANLYDHYLNTGQLLPPKLPR